MRQFSRSNPRYSSFLRSIRTALALPAVVGVLLATSASGLAQEQARIHVHKLRPPQEVSIDGGAVGLSMEVSFSFFDADGELHLNPEIVDATLGVQGNQFEANVQELETPWAIVVLVDISSTMGRSQARAEFAAARDELRSMVNGFPDNTRLALMTFDENVNTPVNFGGTKEEIQQAIGRLQPRTSGRSCLYDALDAGVTALTPASGRRALIVFTASEDDCVSTSAAEVVSLANANRVEIYGLGLSGLEITTQELEAVTLPTGGLADLRSSNTFTFATSKISGVLVNQWLARSTVFPSAGEHSAVLTVNLADGSSLQSEPIPFVSEKDYIPPTQIHIQGNVQSTPGGIAFNMDYIQPQKISQLNLNLVNNETGQTVMAQSLLNFSDTIVVPAVGLSAGLEYTLTVTAVDAAGQVLSQDQAEFEYEPPQSQVVISSITPPGPGEDEFLLEVSARNVPDAVKFRAWLADPDSQEEVEGSRITVPLGDPVLITAGGLASGNYVAIAQALDASDTVLAQSEPTPFRYQRPGPIAVLSSWVQGSPLATIALTGVCCLSLIGLGAIVWLVIPRRRDATEAEFDLVMPDRAGAVRVPRPPVRERKPSPPPPPAPERAPARPPARPPAERPRRAAPPPREAARAEAAPSARLTLIFPESPEYTVEMRKTPFKVGRRDDNDGALPLDSSSGVSGHHLIIFFRDGNYFLRDDGSTFGTTINGQEIPKGDPAQLSNGDRIGLGPMAKVRFEILDK